MNPSLLMNMKWNRAPNQLFYHLEQEVIMNVLHESSRPMSCCVVPQQWGSGWSLLRVLRGLGPVNVRLLLSAEGLICFLVRKPIADTHYIVTFACILILTFKVSFGYSFIPSQSSVLCSWCLILRATPPPVLPILSFLKSLYPSISRLQWWKTSCHISIISVRM